ncbi:MAG: phosphoribosylformylglycinamidine cyclo-ligase [Ruminococcaceae bacterium]|nr:phosphoribosylformylglycinamidine cyclo-ligase [Oscillospiraceae bacterium]
MISYKDSGVDVEAGYEAVRLMKEHVNKTFRPEVLTGLGGFGGAFQLDLSKFENPVLVSGTDGVGTKLKIAFILDKCDTVGIDCVAMCVNDIVCSGAEPLFFLDYIAVGKNVPSKVATIVKGVAEGCLQAGCSLTGGETAEMPGFYSIDEYDIAGFAVGAVSKNKIINGSNIMPGDVLVGLPSSGVHSNGYSLVRKILNPTKERLGEYVNSLGCTVGEELIKPTRIYVKTVLDLISKYNIKGISHVTGGGFFENIPRMGDKSLNYVIHKGTWPILPIFPLLQNAGGVPEENMFNTFNMGIGMVLAVSKSDARSIIDYLASKGENAYLIGEVTDKLPEESNAMIKENLAII